MRKLSPRHQFYLFIAVQSIFLVWINFQFEKYCSKKNEKDYVLERQNNIMDQTIQTQSEDGDQCIKKEVGLIQVDRSLKSMENVIRRHSVSFNGLVKYGGWWQPENCKARETVAIMVPFRRREEQLAIFLNHMHPILQRQQLKYRIFVIEQVGKNKFNKGAIYNIGFINSLQYGDFGCYVFHDVDLLTENDLNNYGCPVSPLHMSAAIDKFAYKLPYAEIFGGVEAFKREHFLTINGFSNSYWGWGAEDDDLYLRVKNNGMQIFRPPSHIARYTMNRHKHFRSSDKNPMRKQLLKFANSRARFDGLNTVNQLAYKTRIIENNLYTLIQVDL